MVHVLNICPLLYPWMWKWLQLTENNSPHNLELHVDIPCVFIFLTAWQLVRIKQEVDFCYTSIYIQCTSTYVIKIGGSSFQPIFLVNLAIRINFGVILIIGLWNTTNKCLNLKISILQYKRINVIHCFKSCIHI